MSPLPFFVTTLTHATWAEARACAAELPEEALPELRLDLFPDQDPEALVAALQGRCLVSCRTQAEGGRWQGSEEERIGRLLRALEGRPRWLDLEWDLGVPEAFRPRMTKTRLLRSVHVPAGVFDLDARLEALPEGDAFKWVGVAARLGDNARLRAPLARARDRGLLLSAFLMGSKGAPSRAMQGARGGRFTYAAPDDGPPAAPGQLALGTMLGWRCHRLHPDHGICGVLGSPVAHSRGPAFHNPRFQRAFKSLLYMPLDCGDAGEAVTALQSLEVLGASITAPLKATLPEALGLPGPLNTLWRRDPGEPWSSANTDRAALEDACAVLPAGPVLVLGGGGVARTSAALFADRGLPVLQVSRNAPATPAEIRALGPVGVVQATSLGMEPGDGAPFPHLLEAAQPSLRWAVEWIYKTDTAFLAWAEGKGLVTLRGDGLFQRQAEAQSRIFIAGCGG